MIRAALALDEAVGETRRVLLDGGARPFRIDIDRWSEHGTRAKLDEIRWGRLGKRLPGGGWFVDLGLDRAGALETTKTGLTEGLMAAVRVKSEAWAEKGPALALADLRGNPTPPDKPGLIAAPQDDPFLRGVLVAMTLTGKEAREAADAAIEEGLAREAAIPDGGELAIDRTRALTAIDVDAGDRKASGADAETFALNLNLAAAQEAARQIGLRGLGGLVVADFVGMAQKRNRKAVSDAFRAALAQALGRASEVLELSSLGLCEAAVARRQRPLADAWQTNSVEREGLDAIRLLESAGWSAPGKKLRARVSQEALVWLEQDMVGWRQALAGRIGARWTLEPAARRPGPPDVWSET